MLACHAGGRGFESRPLRHYIKAPGLKLGALSSPRKVREEGE
ncbi:hypothetical protein SMG44B_30317 [Stenotrophomonas maltophilia]